MEEEQHDDISEQDELSTQIEKNELNAMELMQQAVEKVEAEGECVYKEINTNVIPFRDNFSKISFFPIDIWKKT